MTRLRHFSALLVAWCCLALTPAAHACATCFGKSDSKLAEGMNWGILSLLLIVMCVLGAISAFFIFIARRAASHQSKVR
jgi:hypothetical protein